MKMTQKTCISILAALLLLVTLVSCQKDGYEDNSLSTKDAPEEGTRLGRKIPNPYSITSMQKALASLQQSEGFNGTIDIVPTHLYIKITPQDSTEMNRVLDDTTLNLFPYPLDYELVGEGPYIAPEGSDPEIYTVIPADRILNGVTYTIIEPCFIPEEEDPNLAKLELESMKLTGNITEPEIHQLTIGNTKGLWKKPSGSVKVFNTQSRSSEGVNGVKVLVSWCVKIASTYTDANGNYQIGRGFLFDVHYSAVFRNSKGFAVWSNWGPLVPAIHHVGRHDRRGHDIHIGTGSQAWPWATINNAARIYYDDMCPYFGVTTPHTPLRIWYWNSEDTAYSGAAPMLSQISMHSILQLCSSINLNGEIMNILDIFGLPTIVSRLFLPDIFLYKESISTKTYYKSVFHELGHASHFRQVGPLYWELYIAQTCYNRIIHGSAYGTASNEFNNVIGVGEMWGYYFDYKCRNRYFGNTSIRNDDEWFKPQILKEIEESTNINTFDIFHALTPDIQSHLALKKKLKSLYGNEVVIENIFAQHGF